METTNIPITPGHKYSLYHCSEAAMTRRMEIIVTSVLETPVFRPDYAGSCRGSYRSGTYKRFRKRGEFHLDLKLNRTIVVPGWGNLQADHEAFGNFQMSATINIAGSLDQVRELVERLMTQLSLSRNHGMKCRMAKAFWFIRTLRLTTP